MSSLLTLLGNDIEREAAADSDNINEGVSKAERYITEGEEINKNIQLQHYSVILWKKFIFLLICCFDEMLKDPSGSSKQESTSK